MDPTISTHPDLRGLAGVCQQLLGSRKRPSAGRAPSASGGKLAIPCSVLDVTGDLATWAHVFSAPGVGVGAAQGLWSSWCRGAVFSVLRKPGSTSQHRCALGSPLHPQASVGDASRASAPVSPAEDTMSLSRRAQSWVGSPRQPNQGDPTRGAWTPLARGSTRGALSRSSRPRPQPSPRGPIAQAHHRDHPLQPPG